MCGRYERGTGTLGGSDSVMNVQSLLVDRYGKEAYPYGAQGLAGLGGGRIFDPCAIPGVQQRQCADKQCLLTARRYQNLFGIAFDCAEGAEIFGQGFAKRGISHGIAVAHSVSRDLAGMSADQL